MKFEKGQILMGCVDYWADSYEIYSAIAYGMDYKRGSHGYKVRENHTPHFYMVVDCVGDSIKIAELERVDDYRGERPNWDKPCWSHPTTTVVGKTIKRKVYEKDGKCYVKPESYIEAYLWNGQEEINYTYH